MPNPSAGAFASMQVAAHSLLAIQTVLRADMLGEAARVVRNRRKISACAPKRGDIASNQHTISPVPVVLLSDNLRIAVETLQRRTAVSTETCAACVASVCVTCVACVTSLPTRLPV